MIYKHWVAKFVKAFKLREESGISWNEVEKPERWQSKKRKNVQNIYTEMNDFKNKEDYIINN